MFVFKGQQQEHRFPAAPPRDPIFQPCIEEHHRLLRSPPFCPPGAAGLMDSGAAKRGSTRPQHPPEVKDRTVHSAPPPPPPTSAPHPLFCQTREMYVPVVSFAILEIVGFRDATEFGPFWKKKSLLAGDHTRARCDKGMRWSGGTLRALRVSGQTGRVHQGGLIAAAHLDLKSTGREDTDSFQHLSCYSEAAVQSSIAQASKPSKPLPPVRSKLG